MIKSIFLNAKINEIIKADEIKSEYRNATDAKVKKIVTSINMTVNNEKNKWENDATNDNWKKWARKTDIRRKYESSIFTDITLFVKS